MAKKKDKEEVATDEQSEDSSDAMTFMAERIQAAQDSASQAIQKAIESAAGKIQDGHDPDELQQSANEIAEAVVAEAQAVMDEVVKNAHSLNSSTEDSNA